MKNFNETVHQLYRSSSTLIYMMRSQYLVIFLIAVATLSCRAPKDEIVLRQIKDVVVDSGSSPKLKARAILYNPNNTRIRLKKIDVEIFIAGKKAGEVNQDLKLTIPPKDEFFVDLEVLLSLKEINLADAIFGILGSKKLQVEYKGYLKISYHGLPMKVPVDYKDEIRLKF
jgi:LEA14-like dessication related protein